MIFKNQKNLLGIYLLTIFFITFLILETMSFLLLRFNLSTYNKTLAYARIENIGYNQYSSFWVLYNSLMDIDLMNQGYNLTDNSNIYKELEKIMLDSARNVEGLSQDLAEIVRSIPDWEYYDNLKNNKSVPIYSKLEGDQILESKNYTIREATKIMASSVFNILKEDLTKITKKKTSDMKFLINNLPNGPISQTIPIFYYAQNNLPEELSTSKTNRKILGFTFLLWSILSLITILGIYAILLQKRKKNYIIFLNFNKKEISLKRKFFEKLTNQYEFTIENSLIESAFKIEEFSNEEWAYNKSENFAEEIDLKKKKLKGRLCRFFNPFIFSFLIYVLGFFVYSEVLVLNNYFNLDETEKILDMTSSIFSTESRFNFLITSLRAQMYDSSTLYRYSQPLVRIDSFMKTYPNPIDDLMKVKNYILTKYRTLTKILKQMTTFLIFTKNIL